MKTVSIDKRMLLALAVMGCLSLAVATTYGQVSSSGPDARLIRAMEDTGLEHEIDEDDDVKILLGWDDDRSHWVWVNTLTENYEGIEVREVWGIVAEYASTDDVPKDVLLDLMTTNFQLIFGKYSLVVNEDTGVVTVLFVATVAADLDGVTLKKVISFVGEVADEKEKELEEVPGSDTF